MKIHTLWGWRKNEDTPELMVAWDEISVDGWHEGFDEAIKHEIECWGSDLYAHRFIDLEVDLDEVAKAFQTPQLNVEVKPDGQ